MLKFNSGLTKLHLNLEYGKIVRVYFFDDMITYPSTNPDSGIAILC